MVLQLHASCMVFSSSCSFFTHVVFVQWGFFPLGQIWGRLSPKFRQNRYFIVADPAVASHRSTDHMAVINVLGSVSSIYGVS